MVQSAGLTKKLNAIPRMVKAEVDNQLDKETGKLVGLMKTLVPERSGALKASIKSEDPGPGAKASNGSTYWAVRRVSAGIDGAFHARYQEFGTARMPANPFFFTAWRQERRRIKSAISRAVRRGVKKASKG